MADRIVCWFSCGAASAVATKLAIREHGEVTVVRIVIKSEHPDNDRFAADCSRWFNHPITEIRSDRYADTWDVWEKRRFLVGPKGALCTTELKKMVRHGFEQAGDLQVFGYTVEERERAERFREQSPDLLTEFPLIDAGLSKDECLDLVARAGIELPAMYRLGYLNNNCIGCVKGGMGYWNKIRVTHPDVFARMASLERELGHTVIHSKDGPIYLDQLDPAAGNYGREQGGGCGLFCPDLEDSTDAR